MNITKEKLTSWLELLRPHQFIAIGTSDDDYDEENNEDILRVIREIEELLKT